jgi:hypothetical protein
LLSSRSSLSGAQDMPTERSVSPPRYELPGMPKMGWVSVPLLQVEPRSLTRSPLGQMTLL